MEVGDREASNHCCSNTGSDVSTAHEQSTLTQTDHVAQPGMVPPGLERKVARNNFFISDSRGEILKASLSAKAVAYKPLIVPFVYCPDHTM